MTELGLTNEVMTRAELDNWVLRVCRSQQKGRTHAHIYLEPKVYIMPSGTLQKRLYIKEESVKDEMAMEKAGK